MAKAKVYYKCVKPFETDLLDKFGQFDSKVTIKKGERWKLVVIYNRYILGKGKNLIYVDDVQLHNNFEVDTRA